jgi:2-keto-3-deoxy-L-rhamnonate aldolase RhmA
MTGMKTETSFRSRVTAGEPLLGCFLTWPVAGIAEMLALCGFDFVLLDSEHGFFSIESIASMIAAGDAAGVPTMVRVPSTAAMEVGRCLDGGAAGILFPRSEDISDVRLGVQKVKFPPDGKRGLAGVRASRYGTVPLSEFVQRANQETLVAVQLETIGALSQVGAIAKEKNVDVLYVGPNDLTQALGVPGQYEDPRYRTAVEDIARTAIDAGKVAGIMVSNPNQLADFRRLGYRFFTTSDRTLVLASARTWRAALPR